VRRLFQWTKCPFVQKKKKEQKKKRRVSTRQVGSLHHE
jgi:hypothetical protein